MATTDSDAAIIPVRSERQALDWSLVLASQGIESTIEPPSDTHGLQLSVAANSLQPALAALRLYHAENRGRFWRRQVPGSELVFDWRAVVWFVLIGGLFLLDSLRDGQLRNAGVMDTEVVRAGQWWRVFTAVTVHADAGHLMANCVTGVFLLGLAMGQYSSGLGALAAFLAGAAGNLIALLLFPENHRSLGASGMVLGALGMLAAHALSLFREGFDGRRLAKRSFLAGVLLLVIMGLNPGTDVVAHMGGFAGGVVLGAILSVLPVRVGRDPFVNRGAELLLGALLVASWACALR